MLLACAADLLFALLIVQGVILGMGVLVFWAEYGRLPGRRAWRPYVEAGDGWRSARKVTVGVRRGDQKVALTDVDMESQQYEADLANAVSEARVRAISLSGGDRHARRRLP